MKLTIELDREADGRWIAEVPEWNVLLYGDSRQDAIKIVQSAAREIIPDRIAGRAGCGFGGCDFRRCRVCAGRTKEADEGVGCRPGAALQPAGRLCI